MGILYTGYKVKSTRKNNFSSSTHLVSIPLLLPSPYSLYLLILEKKEGTKYIYIYSRLFSKEASTRRSNVKLLVVRMCVYIPFAQLWATSWLHYPRLFSLREQFIHRLYTVIFFYNELYQADPMEKILRGYYSRVPAYV